MWLSNREAQHRHPRSRPGARVQSSRPFLAASGASARPTGRGAAPGHPPERKAGARCRLPLREHRAAAPAPSAPPFLTWRGEPPPQQRCYSHCRFGHIIQDEGGLLARPPPPSPRPLLLSGQAGSTPSPRPAATATSLGRERPPVGSATPWCRRRHRRVPHTESRTSVPWSISSGGETAAAAANGGSPQGSGAGFGGGPEPRGRVRTGRGDAPIAFPAVLCFGGVGKGWEPSSSHVIIGKAGEGTDACL